MSAITILLVAIVALLAGMEGILDEFQFHQPLVACTLIGLVTGHLQEGILLGGSLQTVLSFFISRIANGPSYLLIGIPATVSPSTRTILQ